MKQAKAIKTTIADKKSKRGRGKGFWGRVWFLTTAGSVAYFLLYRPWQLTWGATVEEVERKMPGDEVFPNPLLNSTRAITIEAPPEAIWPWLVQLGQGRGGWYSYEWIENLLGLDIHNADRILPEFQTLKPGDLISTGAPQVQIPVLSVEPNQSLLIGGPELATISFALYRLDEQHTRLVIRNRGSFPLTPVGLFWLALMDSGIFVMTRKMLLTFKERAERQVQASYPTMDSQPIAQPTPTAEPALR